MVDTRATALTQQITLGTLLTSWERSLRAENKSASTLRNYLASARGFDAYLARQGMPTDPTNVRREHVEAFIVAELERTSPSTAASHFRRLQQLFRWLEDEGEVRASPMAKMSPPKLTEKPVPVLKLDDIRKLFDSLTGSDFPARRDTAIIRVLFDTGMRCAECADIETDDVDLDDGVVRVRGKGDKYRDPPLGAKTVVALDRYLRARARHRYGSLKYLWLGPKGRLTDWGVRQMVERRASKAGLSHITPHQFRHTLAHRWRVADGNETDLMELMGWTSRDMLGRYGRSAAAERARAAHRRLALGDDA